MVLLLNKCGRNMVSGLPFLLICFGSYPVCPCPDRIILYPVNGDVYFDAVCLRLNSAQIIEVAIATFRLSTVFLSAGKLGM